MNIEQMLIAKFESLAKKKVSESDLIKDLKIDSLDLAELIMEAEEKFNISISDQELISLTTVKSIIELIKAKLT
ncbi:phosphopantetheine-binding protein [Mycoplasmopsis bovirhinis]|uniref:phosphopantetheine-binding protein n=1 Tax=Mycoplasmopsis bovirhinis TaxID=29553 RepID=UPI001F1D2F1F|nr:phosphopantetheine-binding protein [Mycoplasmopsis bovirhinis]